MMYRIGSLDDQLGHGDELGSVNTFGYRDYGSSSLDTNSISLILYPCLSLHTDGKGYALVALLKDHRRHFYEQQK